MQKRGLFPVVVIVVLILGFIIGTQSSEHVEKKVEKQFVSETGPNSKGVDLLESGDLEGARTEFERYISEHPSNYFALVGLGWIEYNDKNYDKALTLFERARSIDPNLAPPYHGIGATYLRLKQYDQALDAYNNIEPAIGNYQAALEAGAMDEITFVFTGMGFAHFFNKDFPEAIRNFKNAIAVDDTNINAHIGLAAAYYRIGYVDRADGTTNTIRTYPEPRPYKNWPSYLAFEDCMSTRSFNSQSVSACAPVIYG